MKRIAALLAICVAVTVSRANAAPIYEVKSFGTSGANSIYALYLNTNGTAVNGIDLQATPNAPALWQGPTGGTSLGAPRPAGFAGTYRNRALDLDPADPDNPGIGKGWTLIAPTTNANLLTVTGGPLGGTINSSNEPNSQLFLANFMLPTGSTGKAVITLVNGTATADSQTIPIGAIPEPATLAMAGVALIGMIGASRRRS